VELAGTRCLVTGASSGIGRAVARRLAAAGARLAVHGRDGDALAELAGGRPEVRTILTGDLTRPGVAEAAVADAAAALGAVDVVVAGAGAGWAGPFADMDMAEAERLVALNLMAPVRLTRAALPGMLERRRGRIVLIGSIAGRVGVPDEAVYAATKAGLAAFADSLRAEVAGSGIGVSLVTPGAVDTPFFDRRGRRYGRRIPRLVSPERVAGAVLRCVEGGRAEQTVPRWLAVPARLHGAAPGVYRSLARLDRGAPG
jgi:short-subunit dehydrogenase